MLILKSVPGNSPNKNYAYREKHNTYIQDFYRNVAAQTRHLFARETFDPFVPTIMFRKLRHGDKGAPGANETEGKRGGGHQRCAIVLAVLKKKLMDDGDEDERNKEERK